MKNLFFTQIALALVFLTIQYVPIIGFKHCGKCGHTVVPYPLSTGPNCGDQSYKVRCNQGKLWFDALNGSSYLITKLNPVTQTFLIRPPGLVDPKWCLSGDYKYDGLYLNSSLPFNLTSSNTVVFMNCSASVLLLSINCTGSSICHDYIRGNHVAASACGPSSQASQICCDIKTGGSSTAYGVKARKERCSAYVSYVNLDETLPVSNWPEQGMEIEWQLPREPTCRVEMDCRDLENSVCSPDLAGGGRRCFCKAGYQWDPINGICQNTKCLHGKRCKHHRKTPLIGGLAFSAGAMLIGFVITTFVYVQRKRIRKEALLSLTKVREDILNANNSGKSAKVFSGKEISKATNNFSRENLLGAGGFGEVFKGTFDDGTITAIKRAKLGSTKGIDQILNEVRVLCQVNHRSLVRLLGCCVDLDQPLLVYEYVPNGTLFDHLHGYKSHKGEPILWRHRLRIAHQTAEGLAYLHFSAIPRIYHRDIKSSNILLDEELNAKVADFGLSRLAVSEASHITTSAQGTLGYLDPEYYMNYQLTDKSDVYSFGVVLLELLTSNKAIDFNREEEDVNLVVFTKRCLKEDMLMDAVDPLLREGASKLELDTMKALGFLAVACLEEKRQNRPSMNDVVAEIEYVISILTSSTESGVEDV